MTAAKKPVMSEAAWRERELAKAGPLSEAQQRDLRRVLLPTSVPKPARKPA